MAREVSEFAGVVDCGVFLKKKKRGGGIIALGFGVGSWRFFSLSFSHSLLFSNGCNVWKLEPCFNWYEIVM